MSSEVEDLANTLYQWSKLMPQWESKEIARKLIAAGYSKQCQNEITQYEKELNEWKSKGYPVGSTQTDNNCVHEWKIYGAKVGYCVKCKDQMANYCAICHHSMPCPCVKTPTLSAEKKELVELDIGAVELLLSAMFFKTYVAMSAKDALVIKNQAQEICSAFVTKPLSIDELPGKRIETGEFSYGSGAMSFNKVMFSSAHDNWSTPKDVYDKLDSEFHFNFDPCPLHGIGGLDSDWGTVNFVNPPYSDIKKWVEKAYYQWHGFGKTVVMLIPSRTDTRWWHDYVMKATEIRFIKGRLKFGGSKNSAPFPSCIVVFNGLL